MQMNLPMIRNRKRLRLAAGMAVGLVLSAGCVRQTIEPEYHPRVSTSQNSDGLVTLSWETRVGYDYSLFVVNPETREWQPLKGSKVYPGTGESITVTDRRNPRQPLPWYSVRAQKR